VCELQFEWSTRPLQDQGVFAAVALIPVADPEDTATIGSTQHDMSASNSLATINANRQDLAYADVHNGKCRLLYAPLQLHLRRRKVSQLQLLTLEEQVIYTDFNEKFCALRKGKDQLLGKIAGKLARVALRHTR